ncbi:MAG: prolipoprotein diacylglyceryl transferase, partial [Coriobacteriia bacterium]|nr:prolipoprotein diacylglyceryl transferase [Coriobacteriia bacterium]
RRADGFMFGVFMFGYGAFRFIIEFMREPDAQLGLLWGGATMGQLLSLPMIVLGAWFVVRVMRKAVIAKGQHEEPGDVEPTA